MTQTKKIKALIEFHYTCKSDSHCEVFFTNEWIKKTEI